VNTHSAERALARSERKPHALDDAIVRRVRAEFLEMPGLCLTRAQAQRLWGLEPHTCELLLEALIESRFLRRTAGGLFVLQAPRR